MIDQFDKGWDSIEVLLSQLLEECPYAEIESKERRLGMFHVKFKPMTSPAKQFILDCITYMLERKSVWICERCGNKGFIRKQMTPRKILCLPCYAFTLSDIAETLPQEAPMFYTKEDLDELAPAVNTVFGEQGKWLDVPKELIGMVVSSTKYGTLWYGDVPSLEWLAEHCEKLKLYPEFEHDTLTVSRLSDVREILTF